MELYVIVRSQCLTLLLPLLGVGILSAGCHSRRPFVLDRVQDRSGLVLIDCPCERQTSEIDCGSTALSAVLNYWGKETTPEDVLKRISADVPSDRPVTAGDLRSAAEEYGLRSFLLSLSAKDIRDQIAKGRPLIVCRRRWLAPNHFEIAVGYDEHKEQFVLLDPLAGRYSVGYSSFEERQENLEGFALLVALGTETRQGEGKDPAPEGNSP